MRRRRLRGAAILPDSNASSIDGSRSGGIGRRTRLKIWRVATPVGVRLPPPAPFFAGGGVDFLSFSCYIQFSIVLASQRYVRA